LDVQPQAVSDPLALIIAGGSAAISALLMLVTALIGSRAKHAEKAIKEHDDQIRGLDLARVALEGRMKTSEAEVGALKAQTLSREIFDRATNEQNSKLEDIKRQTGVLTNKVDNIDRGLIARPVYDSPPPPPPRRGGPSG
jgi:hypothetical protein